MLGITHLQTGIISKVNLLLTKTTREENHLEFPTNIMKEYLTKIIFFQDHGYAKLNPGQEHITAISKK